MTNPLMTNEGMMKHMADFAASNFAETGELLPMWILVSVEGEIHPVVTPYEGEESKNAVAALIHGLIKKHNIIRIGHMSEVWYLDMKEGDPLYNDMRDGLIQPSECPDRRKEAITIQVQDHFGENMQKLFDIVRHEDGKPTLAENPRMYMDSKMGHVIAGRFANFFPNKEKVH